MSARRRVLQLLLAGAGAPLAPRAAAQPARTADAGWAFFTPADRAFIEPAVDRLIPPDRFAGARDAGVPTYLDRQLAGPYGAGARMYLQAPFDQGTPQQGYQLGMTPAQMYRAALDGLPPHLGGRAFGTRSAAEQDAFLKRLEAGELMLGAVPSAVFFETLLANTIEGFFADPLYGGNRDMAGWKMIGFPGAYAMYVDVVAAHGLRYERAPIPIAVGAGGHEHGHGPADGNAPRR